MRCTAFFGSLVVLALAVRVDVAFRVDVSSFASSKAVVVDRTSYQAHLSTDDTHAEQLSVEDKCDARLKDQDDVNQLRKTTAAWLEGHGYNYSLMTFTSEDSSQIEFPTLPEKEQSALLQQHKIRTSQVAQLVGNYPTVDFYHWGQSSNSPEEMIHAAHLFHAEFVQVVSSAAGAQHGKAIFHKISRMELLPLAKLCMAARSREVAKSGDKAFCDSIWVYPSLLVDQTLAVGLEGSVFDQQSKEEQVCKNCELLEKANTTCLKVCISVGEDVSVKSLASLTRKVTVIQAPFAAKAVMEDQFGKGINKKNQSLQYEAIGKKANGQSLLALLSATKKFCTEDVARCTPPESIWLTHEPKDEVRLGISWLFQQARGFLGLGWEGIESGQCGPSCAELVHWCAGIQVPGVTEDVCSEAIRAWGRSFNEAMRKSLKEVPDVLRSTVVVSSPEKIRPMIEELTKRFEDLGALVAVFNKWMNVQRNGYAGVHLYVKMCKGGCKMGKDSSSIIAEIQLHFSVTSPLATSHRISHKFYEHARAAMDVANAAEMQAANGASLALRASQLDTFFVTASRGIMKS